MSQVVLRGYIDYLERGAATHAAYAHTASAQSLELSERLEKRVAAIEDSPDVQIMDMEITANRVEILNLEASTHTVGLSICLVGLAVLAALGHDVPKAPPLADLDAIAESGSG